MATITHCKNMKRKFLISIFDVTNRTVSAYAEEFVVMSSYTSLCFQGNTPPFPFILYNCAEFSSCLNTCSKNLRLTFQSAHREWGSWWWQLINQWSVGCSRTGEGCLVKSLLEICETKMHNTLFILQYSLKVLWSWQENFFFCDIPT